MRRVFQTVGSRGIRSFAQPKQVAFFLSRGFAKQTFPVPPMGESISDGSIAAWKKKTGDQVARDEVVCEIETAKVNIEIRSPEAGVLTDIFADVSSVVEVGADLFTLDVGATGGNAGAAAPAPAPSAPAKEAPKQAAAPAPAHAPAPAKPAAPSPAPAAASKAQEGVRVETRVAMTRMRSTIAQRLKESQNTNAILTTFNEVDMHNIIEMRNQHKDAFEKKHGVKLGLMSAFVKASANALVHEPSINAVIDGNEIVYRNYVDISVAVSSPTGLVVPVLRDVQNMSFADIEKAIALYGEKAKNRTLALEDMVGGTFTVSNGGIFGSLFSTPIINPPQSAVLGMHGINKKPWVVNDQIVIRPIMMIAMSYDHRLVDGREAVVFLKHIKTQIENPTAMLLGL